MIRLITLLRWTRSSLVSTHTPNPPHMHAHSSSSRDTLSTIPPPRLTFLSLKITFSAARIQFCAVQLSVAVLLPPRLILALLLSVCAKVYVKSLGEEKLPE